MNFAGAKYTKSSLTIISICKSVELSVNDKLITFTNKKCAKKNHKFKKIIISTIPFRSHHHNRVLIQSDLPFLISHKESFCELSF